MAAVTAMLLPIPGWLTVGLQLLLAASLVRTYRNHIAKSAPRAIVEALWDIDGQWLLTLASGDVVEAKLRPDSFVSVPLVVLNFKTAPWWRNSSLLLTGDALDKDLLRKLRVRLKLGDGKALAAPI